jgi:predicted GNAT family N-acyltransferase
MAIEIIDFLSERQINDLHDLYQSAWWSKDRELAEIKRMLKNTSIIVAIRDIDAKKVIAFSRILTDFVYKAIILDMIVAPDYRGYQLDNLMIDTICHHPKLISVKTFELMCRSELIPFYKKWNFVEDSDGMHLMRYTREEGYAITEIESA